MAVGRTMNGPYKNFKLKDLRWQESAILKLDFANTVCHKSAILLIFAAESTECVV